MRRRIAVLGISDDAIDALPRLAARSDVELACVYDADAIVIRRRLALYEPHAAALLQKLLTDDPAALDGAELVPAAELAALAGGAEAASRDARAELVAALGEIADAAALVDEPAEAFARLLDAAIGATGATAGSLLLVDAASDRLRLAASTAVERELWPKIALERGRGIAGRAWADARPLRVRGLADPTAFDLVGERRDVASAALLPIAHGGAVRGVLCLHHASDDAHFSAADAEPLAEIAAQLGRVAAAIAQREGERGAARLVAVDAALREAIASGPDERRFTSLCRVAAEWTAGGTATLWWSEDPRARSAPLRLVASSLPGGALGAAASLAPGDGLDGRAARDREAVFLSRDGALAYAALPLVHEGALFGVLALQMGGTAVDSEPALRAFASFAARELSRIEALAAARDRADRADALREAALRIVAAPDVDRAAAALATSAALLLAAEHAIVRVLDPVRRTLQLRAQTADAAEATLAALDRRIAREAARTRAPIVVARDDETGDPPALAVPLLEGARVLGTLGVYGRRAPAPETFGGAERAAAQELAAFAARALAAVSPHETATAASVLLSGEAWAKRIEAEIARARASGTSAAFALATLRIENEAQLGAAATARAIERVAAALTVELRSFDCAVQSAPAAIAVLLPEPGEAIAERVARLARAVAEQVARTSTAEPVALVFGYAAHPEDGATADALARRANEPRLRML
jgi:GGDEF domain-containing protein